MNYFYNLFVAGQNKVQWRDRDFGEGPRSDLPNSMQGPKGEEDS